MDIELADKPQVEASPQPTADQQSVVSEEQRSTVVSPTLADDVPIDPCDDTNWYTEEEKKTWSFRITDIMSEHPVAVCGSIFSIIVIIVIMVAATGMASISTQTQYDWDIPTTAESQNNDALTDAVDNVDLLGGISGVRRQPYENQFFFVFTSRDGTDLFSPANLQDMCVAEGLLAQDPKFVDFCQLDEAGECMLPGSSVVVHFYSFTNLSQWDCSLLSNIVVDQKKNEIYDAMTTTEGLEQYGLWLSKGSIERGYSTKAESVWIFGAPLAGYDTPSDHVQEQFDKYSELLTTPGKVGGVEKSLFEHFHISTNANNFLAYYPSPYMSKAKEGDVETQWYSSMNGNNETTRVVGSDLLFASFSIIFVLFWLRMHTKSTFIACMGMFMIFCSLPFSIFIYRAIYGIPFFTELHSLVLFIVLGVGADDVFVLVDGWKDSVIMYPGDITNGINRHLVHRRLFHTFKHTLGTVFNTSFTTAMAFISTGFSPLMPIATFGWFAATCIVANYLFVMTLMPPVVIIHAMYLTHGCIPRTPAPMEPMKAAPIAMQDADVDVETGAMKAVPPTHPNSHTVIPISTISTKENEEVMLGDDSVQAAQVPTAQKMLTNGSHVQLPTQDQDVVDTATVDTNLDLALSVNLDHTMDEETHKIMDESKPMVDGYVHWMTHRYKLPDFIPGPVRALELVSWVIFIGLLGYGLVGTYYGTALQPPTEQEKWLPSQHMFTLITQTLMTGFLGFDDAAFEQVTLTMGISGINRHGYDRFKPGINRGHTIYDTTWDLSVPSCQTVMMKMCDEIEVWPCAASGCSGGMLARTNTTECFMRTFHTWAQDTYSEDTLTMDSSTFYTRLADFRENTTRTINTLGSWQDQIGFIGGELMFGSVFFTSTMQQTVSFADKLDVERRINSLIKKIQGYPECDTCSCENLRFTSPYAFAWMRTEIGLVNGFYNGLAIAFPVSFLVLIFATGNIYITVLAIVTVFFIVFGVLGFVNFSLGWSLGVAESIAGIIIIGFSVDYTVHLGHMYTEGEEMGLHSRELKFKYTSKKMVTTVVGGAITTIGAGVFMFACQMQFFVKMAVLIVGTIVLSVAYSLGFFMSVLILTGPQRDQGNLKPYIRKGWALVFGESDEKTK